MTTYWACVGVYCTGVAILGGYLANTPCTDDTGIILAWVWPFYPFIRLGAWIARAERRERGGGK